MNANAVITLAMYWSIAIGLLYGGLFTLSRGFRLVLSGKGKTKEESTLELLGFKATVGSIGSLVMISAFLWGWAAAYTLPSYKDRDVTIGQLKTAIEQKDHQLAAANREIVLARETQAKLDDELGRAKNSYVALLRQQTVKVAKLQNTLQLLKNNVNKIALTAGAIDVGTIEVKAAEAAAGIGDAAKTAAGIRVDIHDEINKLAIDNPGPPASAK